MPSSSYCLSRVRTLRRTTREVKVGSIGVGGDNPIRVQSMTTTETLDVEATSRQTIELAEAGCEIVRITAQNVRAAEALAAIAKKVRGDGFDVPLVADIHFLPQAAMEAAKHVEKVRVNPGNYADRKKFAVREYSDLEYEEELERLHAAFSPLVLRCKELGRSMRIGTNHGSLSDRILNRFGDTPRGMAESALEFIRIAESHNYREIILSMKASNPKVMIEAYRLVVALMNDESMEYPLHLGVTEAGDGEDARIKSAAGIGSLLLDGLGDTIRVSLTEDPVHEIPVAQDLAARTETLWQRAKNKTDAQPDEGIDPFEFRRRECIDLTFSPNCKVGPKEPPRVIVPAGRPLEEFRDIVSDLSEAQTTNKDAPIEGLLLSIKSKDDFAHLATLRETLVGSIPFLVIDQVDGKHEIPPEASEKGSPALVILRTFTPNREEELIRFLGETEKAGHKTALVMEPRDLGGSLGEVLKTHQGSAPIITLSKTSTFAHPVGAYRGLAAQLRQLNLPFPIWIRSSDEARIHPDEDFFSSRLLDSAILTGSLLCDGIGDLLSVENAPDSNRSRALAYNLLQGARARSSKTEFVACPSCGRTLFDLQSTTQRVKESTSHLKGVTIAVMGCIVNGPGEMADADFGYVGSAPGKIDLYVGKNRVKSAISEKEAVDRLVRLIKEEGKWTEP